MKKSTFSLCACSTAHKSAVTQELAESYAKLRLCDLSGFNLSCYNLAYSDMLGAFIIGANFSGCDLTRARC